MSGTGNSEREKPKLWREQLTNIESSEEKDRLQLFTIICAVGVPTGIGYIIYDSRQGNLVLSLILTVVMVVMVSCLLLARRGVKQRPLYRFTAVVFCAMLWQLVSMGGEGNSRIFWTFLYPIFFFALLGKEEGAVWGAALWFAILGYFFLPGNWLGGQEYPVAFAVRFLLVYSIVNVFIYYYEALRQDSRLGLLRSGEELIAEIEQRQLVEKHLRESEALYRGIYLQAAEGILLTDSRGEIVDCNPQFEKMVGQDKRGLVGLSIFSLFHPDDLKRVPPQLDNLNRGATILVERQLRTRSGIYLLCEQSGRKISDELIILLYRDITERKIAELALERANEALDRLAHQDGLTGVANRRRFDQSLEQEYRRMKREGKSLSVILADIDFFKQFNDVYGHQAGDDCLRLVASTLAATVHRPGDLVARYGGEEFVILLPDTDHPAAMQLAQKMCTRIASLRVTHRASRAAEHITLSLGVATMAQGDDLTEETLLGLADKALYQAKEGGRNRVVG